MIETLPESPKDKRFRLLGVEVHALSADDLHQLMRRAIADRKRISVVSQNLHGVYSYHREPAMKDLHARSFVRVDGIPILWWGKLLGYRFRAEHRMGWVDWMPRFLDTASAASWRVFYLGAPPGIAAEGANRLLARFPAATIGTHHGHFDQRPDSSQNGAVLRTINDFRPDILLVGMGMPRQERWVLQNRERLDVPVVVTCGAAIEYFAGTMKTPPRWTGALGVEWLYRLISEPRRLAKRYLLEPWALLPLVARDLYWLAVRRTGSSSRLSRTG
jgi:N-acetylglucosaminyldiphosphoundecaprenol N-acetyl-beta-D-mannosaminyltransferase